MKIGKKHSLWLCLGTGLVLMVAVAIQAETTNEEASLHAELMQVKGRLAELEAKQNESWLNRRRAEEVKALIQDVLTDADMRASLLESGMTAGHNGEHFYLSSEDGSFMLKLNGQIQVRYTASFQDDDPGGEDLLTGDALTTPVSVVDDNNETGFNLRRAKIGFSGHIADPRIQYVLQLSVDHHDNNASADHIALGYELMEDVSIWGGEYKAPFLREELTSSASQLAVDRSYVSEFFTLDKVQGIGLDWRASDDLKIHVMVNDGYRSGDGGTAQNPYTQTGSSQVPGEALDDHDLQIENADAEVIGFIGSPRGSVSKDFNDDQSDIAVTARADVKLAGDWSQTKDYSAWSGEETGLFVGAAIHWELGEAGDTGFNNDYLAWTLDASLEQNGANAFAAIVGQHTDLDGGTLAHNQDLYGLVVQGGYMIVPDKLEPFVRWEYLDLDDASIHDEVQIVTVGANYYLAHHNAKFTVDLLWALDPLPTSQDGLGLQADDAGSEDQVVLRAQFQVLF